MVKAVTKSGTNQFHATAWSFYSGNMLTGDKDVNGKTIRNDYTVKQFGANLSAPIIKDKRHFFVNFDTYQNTAPFRAYDFNYEETNQLAAEKNLLISKANLDKVVDILVSDYGVPDVQQYGEIPTKVLTNAIFARLDYTMNKKNNFTFYCFLMLSGLTNKV